MANGSQQVMLEGTGAGRYSGYIDLGEMQAGDTIVVRQYILINGSYKVYHTESYADAQGDPVLYVQPKESVAGIKLTLQQQAGINRSFAYQFIVERLLAPGISI